MIAESAFFSPQLLVWMRARTWWGSARTLCRRIALLLAHRPPTFSLEASFLPNTVQPVIVGHTAARRSVAWGSEPQFFGLASSRPTESWGAMLARAYQAMDVAPEQMYPPGLAILFTALAFNALG